MEIENNSTIEEVKQGGWIPLRYLPANIEDLREIELGRCLVIYCRRWPPRLMILA